MALDATSVSRIARSWLPTRRESRLEEFVCSWRVWPDGDRRHRSQSRDAECQVHLLGEGDDHVVAELVLGHGQYRSNAGPLCGTPSQDVGQATNTGDGTEKSRHVLVRELGVIVNSLLIHTDEITPAARARST